MLRCRQKAGEGTVKTEQRYESNEAGRRYQGSSPSYFGGVKDSCRQHPEGEAHSRLNSRAEQRIHGIAYHVVLGQMRPQPPRRKLRSCLVIAGVSRSETGDSPLVILGGGGILLSELQFGTSDNGSSRS